MEKRIFQSIKGTVVNNQLFQFSDKKLVFQNYNPYTESQGEKDLKLEVTNDPYLISGERFSLAKQQLESGTIPYFVTSTSEGYFLVWLNVKKKLCARHFDFVMGNSAIKNEAAPLYKQWNQFKHVSFKNSNKYTMN